MAYTQMGYWRRQTRVHQRQTRSSSVTVSACTVPDCTVPDCKLWRVYRGTARVPTNQMSAVQVARVRTHFLSCPKLNLPRNGDANQSNESSTRTRCRQNLKILRRFERRGAVEWRGCLYLMSTHSGETYLSLRDGEPLLLTSSLKLIVVGS